MDHLRLQSAFKFVAISRFGDGGQLMTTANLCLEAVKLAYWQILNTVYKKKMYLKVIFYNN